MVKTQNLGPISDYAIAVKYGYTGTEEEWSNAVNANRQASEASATSAANSAAEALTAANSAKASAANIASSAISANNSADSAIASATSANSNADSAQTSADSAIASATSANSSANSAKNSADSATAAATGAANSASEALTAANSAKATVTSISSIADSADAAATRANTAAKAAEGVVAGDLLIDKPDGTAGYNRLYIDDVQTVARDTKTTIPAMRTIDTQPKFKLYGYSHQDGVPTPENPIDPVSLQSPLKVTIGTTDYSIPLTASDTTTYPDPLELHSLPTVTDAIINDYAILRSRKFTFNGTEHKWNYASGTFNLPDDTSYNYAVFVSYDLTVIDNMLCDKFIYKPFDHGFYQDVTSESISGGGGYRLVFIRIAKSRLTGWSETWTSTQKVTAFKTWLAANPVTIIYQLVTPLTIPLSSDTQTALNNLRTAIAPLASGKALTVTSDAPMDIISRGKFHQQQEQIDSNAANIADNQLSFAAQMAQQEIEIKEQTTPFTKVTGNTDMDALSTTGIYGIATSSYTNGPPGMTYHGLLIVDKNGDGTQTFLPDSTVSSVYRRVGYSDGTWGAWSEEAWVTPSQISAWTAKADKSTTINGKALSGNITLTAEDIGAIPSSVKGVANGVATLDDTGKIPKAQLPTTGIAPANVSGLAATAGNKEVAIVWSDPADSVIEGVTLSKWAGSKLVRKEGAYPTNVTDGVLLVDNKTRDTYKTTGYVDAGLTNGTTYYYAVFPYSDTGAVNKDEANRVSAVPTTYPLPACTGISAAAGNGQITICWSDPADVAGKVTWAGSKLVRKEGSYPSAVTDGTLLIDNTTRDHYKTTGYVDAGLTNGTTYYYMIFPYSTTGEITVNTANQVSATPQAYVKYGVRWHKNQSSPTLERLYDSADFTFSATNGSTAGSSDFDSKPIYKDIKCCNVQNGAVTAYEGEAGFTRDGTNGDVCVEIPKFYYQVTDTTDYRDFVISDGPLDGFLVAPRHSACGDYPNGLDKIYVGAYEASVEYKSISGAAPIVNLTREQFRTGFAGRGAGYCQADWATQFELQALYAVEMAHLNSQLVVGNGNVNSPAAINTGGSDSVAGMTGCADKASYSIAVKYRGLENLWGNICEFRDGINFDDGLIYVCTNPSKYADDTATNYTKLAYSKIQGDGYISSLGLDANVPWTQIPTGAAGSDSTYLCDKYYYNPGWLVACVGGNWYGGSSAGLFSFNSSYNSSGYSSATGSRLLILPKS